MDGYVVVTVENGAPLCDCGGSAAAVCDHIDAALLCGEMGVVHEDDVDAAAQAVLETKFSLFGPPTWSRRWRQDQRWLGRQAFGAALQKLRDSYGPDYDDRPKVCFTGDGEKGRDDYLREARERGWRAVDNWQAGIKVMVAADPDAITSKLVRARANGVPIVSYAEWEKLGLDGEVSE